MQSSSHVPYAIPSIYTPFSTCLSRGWPGQRLERLEQPIQRARLCVNVSDLLAQAILHHASGNETLLIVVVQGMLEQLIELVNPQELLLAFDGVLPLQMLALLRQDLHAACKTQADLARLAPLLAGSRAAEGIQRGILTWLRETVDNFRTRFIPAEVPGDALLKLRLELGKLQRGPTIIYGRTNAHVLTAWVTGSDLLYVSLDAGTYFMPAPVAPLPLLPALVRYDQRLVPVHPELRVSGVGNGLAYVDLCTRDRGVAAAGPPPDRRDALADELYALSVANAVSYYRDGTMDPRFYFSLPSSACTPEVVWREPRPQALDLLLLSTPTCLPRRVALALVVPMLGPQVANGLGLPADLLVRVGQAAAAESSDPLPLRALVDAAWLDDLRLGDTDKVLDDLPATNIIDPEDVRPRRAQRLDPAIADAAIQIMHVDGELALA